MKSNEKKLRELLAEARDDKNIIGFFLGGSRGKKQETKFSDYDVIVVVKDKVGKVYRKKYQEKNNPPFGFSVFSLSEFRKYATIGSSSEWDRASFTHLRAAVDKTGEIQKLIDEKGVIPRNQINNYVAGNLDAYINYIYRSLKCFRDGNYVGARLEAARSIERLLNIIFGIEGRVTPYYKYLELELKKFPLKKFFIKPARLMAMILNILKSADIRTQQKLFNAVETVFRKNNFAKVFDNWEDGAIILIRTFKK